MLIPNLLSYPSIFQPTEKFQLVHDDQSLPPGLHIRMNLATGVKEARLNVPEAEAAHSDLVIIDEPEPHHNQAILEETPPRVRPPRFDADEANLFHYGLSTLKSSSTNDEVLVPTLSDLQELCHSQDWGVALTKDGAAIRFLVQILQEISGKIAIRSLSALLLATAIQNNPEALSAALSHLYNDEGPKGPLDAVMLALLHDQCPQLLTRIVFLLSALCQDPQQLALFANAGGLEILLRVFDVEHVGQDERDKLRGKIANFVLDHLDQLNDVVAVAEGRKAAEALVEEEGQNHYQKDDGDWVIVDHLEAVPEAEASNFNRSVFGKALIDWEDAFGKGIDRLKTSKQNPESAALNSFVEAYSAIRKRLESP